MAMLLKWHCLAVLYFDLSKKEVLEMIGLYNNSLFYQLDAQILYLNTFITFLYMFRALLCSSSGGHVVLLQPLISSLSLGDFSTQVKRGILCIPLLTCVLKSPKESDDIRGTNNTT